MREYRMLMRAKRFAQNPPPMSRVYLFFGILAAALAVAAVEHWAGWPDWATLEPGTRRDVMK